MGEGPGAGCGGETSGWGGAGARGEASPLEALVCVVDESEGGDEELARHAAELPAEAFHVLADALVPAHNTEQLDRQRGGGRRERRGYLLL